MNKAFFLLLSFSLLTACSMGINQSSAMIHGKPYLVEKEFRNFFWIKSFSSKPKYTNLEQEEPDYEIAREYVEKMRILCKNKYRGNTTETMECLFKSIQKDN